MLDRLKKLASLFNRRDKLQFLGLLALMFVGAILEVVGIGAIPAFVAALATPERVMAHPSVAPVLDFVGITTAPQLVVWGSVALIIVFALKNSFIIALHVLEVSTTEKYQVRLADRLFEAYMRAPYVFFLGRNSAELLRNVHIETREIVLGVLTPILQIVMASIMTIFIAVFLMVAAPAMSLFGVLIVGGCSWAFSRVIRQKLITTGIQAQQLRGDCMRVVNEGLGSLTDARILRREGHFIARYHDVISRFTAAARVKHSMMKVSTPVLEFITVVGLLLIIMMFAVMGSDVTTLIPTLALFAAAMVRIRSTVSVVVGGISGLRHNIAAVDPVVDDIALLKREADTAARQAEKIRPEDGRRLQLAEGIRVENLTYTYPNVASPAIKGVTLSIEKGQSVAFVGSTGSGKTTMVNILLGLLTPQDGTVKIDEVDIHSSISAWHANIGYVPQTIYLIDDTIRRNIALGLPEDKIDEEKLWTAIRAAQLEGFVKSLDDGINTTVGERGVRLSGGQRQRIGLARALYNNPEVLIMDEATSALDNQTENLVMQALDDLKDGRTIIMIAHRLSTVRKCDRIYFMKGGEIEAAGTYDELSYQHEDFRQMAQVA